MPLSLLHQCAQRSQMGTGWAVHGVRTCDTAPLWCRKVSVDRSVTSSSFSHRRLISMEFLICPPFKTVLYAANPWITGWSRRRCGGQT